MPRKRSGVAVHGMLLLDKPAGITSNRALQHAKRMLNARKAGHTGSLDPIATGLLPLCFGETTGIAGMFLDADKTYRTELQLGADTDTGDCDGQIMSTFDVSFNEAQLHAALEKFRGQIKQVPPMYSALKRDGRPLYELARKGVTVKREARDATVYELTLDEWRGDVLTLTLSCSRGFYVRQLAADLGEVLGCGGHVRALRRLRVGDFSVDDAVTLAQLESQPDPAARRRYLLPTERALAHLPELHLPENIAGYFCNGRPVRVPPPEKTPQSGSGLVRVYSPATGFLGLAEPTADGKLIPKRLFNRA